MNSEFPRLEVLDEEIAGYRSHRLRAGSAEAVIVDDAGGLVHQIRLVPSRSGQPSRSPSTMELLEPPADEELVGDPWFHGRVLCPFNDRIPNGLYRWGDRTLQLASNAPEDGSAIHGLVYSRRLATAFTGRARSDAGGAEGAMLRLETGWSDREYPGYPFALFVELSYLLTETTFTFEISTQNRGDAPAPVAFGWHPYFTLGVPVDEVSIQMNASEFIPVDDNLMPTGALQSVEGSSVDFRALRPIGDSAIDLALVTPRTGLTTLSSARGSIQIEIPSDPFRYIQLFTHPNRDSIAVEPVTAATNAFNRPELGLRVLGPGERLVGSVRISCM